MYSQTVHRCVAQVPAALVLLSREGPASARHSALLAAQIAKFEAGAADRRAHPAVRDAAARGLVQAVNAEGMRTVLHNVKAARTTQLKYLHVGTKLAEQAAAAEDSEKVKVTMFMESRCPGCRHFSLTTLKELLQTPGMDKIVDFHAVSWGWARVLTPPTPEQIQKNDTHGNIVNETLPLLSLLRAVSDPFNKEKTPPFSFTCQHGFSECQGNAIEACLQDVAPAYPTFFPVLDCIEARTCAEGMKPPACVGSPPEVAGGCFDEFGEGGHAMAEAVMQCYNGPRAQELLLMNDLETAAADPQWVPWFTLDGRPIVSKEDIESNSTLAFRSQQLMGAKICDLYVKKTGKTPPAACTTFPQTVDELPSQAELDKKFPETNFTSLIAHIRQEKQEMRQRAQQNLAWQMQAARNYAMRQQEQQMQAHEEREEQQQRMREQSYAELGGKRLVHKKAVGWKETASGHSWWSLIKSAFESV